METGWGSSPAVWLLTARVQPGSTAAGMVQQKLPPPRQPAHCSGCQQCCCPCCCWGGCTDRAGKRSCGRAGTRAHVPVLVARREGWRRWGAPAARSQRAAAQVPAPRPGAGCRFPAGQGQTMEVRAGVWPRFLPAARPPATTPRRCPPAPAGCPSPEAANS